MWLVACSGQGNEDLELQQPQISLHTAADSNVQDEQLRVDLQPLDDGWLLELQRLDSRPASSLLVELRFGDDWLARDAVQEAGPAQLNLVVADRPGVLALGMINRDGTAIESGTLLRARLIAAQADRHSSALPSGNRSQVMDLEIIDDGENPQTLAWSYRNNGDYDQNSEANISDLTPLSTRIFESTSDGELDELDGVLDGDGNGEVNIADITTLGQNFLARVGGYRVYSADTADIETANVQLLGEVAFSESSLAPQSRRTFSYEPLQQNQFLFVRAWDGSTDDVSVASNVVQMEIAAAQSYIYNLAPAGDQVVVDSQCISPGIVSYSEHPDYSEDGACVIVYIVINASADSAQLMMAWHDSEQWLTREIGSGNRYGAAQAMLLPEDEGGPGLPLVLAYDVTQSALVARYYDHDWNLVESETVDSGSGALTILSADLSADGMVGVASAWNGESGSELRFSEDDGSGWQGSTVYSGTDTLGGLSFRYDPLGGDPWLLFTHGSIDTEDTLLLDFSMQQGRLSEGNWQLSELGHPDSPLFVDLGFRADGSPQLAFTAARDYTINIPTFDPITLSLLMDVNTGEYSGGNWDMQRAYESEFGVSVDFLNGLLILSLDMAPAVGWATSDELLYTAISGSVDVAIATQMPEDGTLDSSNQYMVRSGGHAYNNSSKFSAAAGRSHAWASFQGQPNCCYVRSSSLEVSDLLGGNFSAAGELAYWRP